MLTSEPPFTGALEQRENGRFTLLEGYEHWISAYRVTRTYPLVVTIPPGGSAPFTELVDGAGLRSPFEAGALKDVVREAASVLE